MREPPLPHGKAHDDPLDERGEKMSAGKDDGGHPYHWKVEQPVTHDQPRRPRFRELSRFAKASP